MSDHIPKVIEIEVLPDQEPPELLFRLEFDRLSPQTQQFRLEASRGPELVQKIKAALARVPKSA